MVLWNATIQQKKARGTTLLEQEEDQQQRSRVLVFEQKMGVHDAIVVSVPYRRKETHKCE
jgi:hypothetical protein